MRTEEGGAKLWPSRRLEGLPGLNRDSVVQAPLPGFIHLTLCQAVIVKLQGSTWNISDFMATGSGRLGRWPKSLTVKEISVTNVIPMVVVLMEAWVGIGYIHEVILQGCSTR